LNWYILLGLDTDEIGFLLKIQKTGLPHQLEIEIPYSDPTEHDLTIANLTQVLSEIIPVFEPDFAVLRHIVKQPAIKRPIIQLPSGAPYAIRLECLTYFGKPYLDYVGSDRFEKLDEFVMIKKLYEGLLIQLQEPLFDLNDPVHRMREEQILDKLDLDEFRHDK
jgi:hypothetical protein